MLIWSPLDIHCTLHAIQSRDGNCFLILTLHLHPSHLCLHKSTPVNINIRWYFLPRELLLRWRLDYKKHCRVLPGTYWEMHDEPSPSNMMVVRTHKGIALGPTGNLQGTMKFYCLNTELVLKRRSFTPLVPMLDRIKWVSNIGAKDKQGCTFRFLNRKKEPYE